MIVPQVVYELPKKTLITNIEEIALYYNRNSFDIAAHLSIELCKNVTIEKYLNTTASITRKDAGLGNLFFSTYNTYLVCEIDGIHDEHNIITIINSFVNDLVECPNRKCRSINTTIKALVHPMYGDILLIECDDCLLSKRCRKNRRLIGRVARRMLLRANFENDSLRALILFRQLEYERRMREIALQDDYMFSFDSDDDDDYW